MGCFEAFRAARARGGPLAIWSDRLFLLQSYEGVGTWGGRVRGRSRWEVPSYESIVIGGGRVGGRGHWGAGGGVGGRKSRRGGARVRWWSVASCSAARPRGWHCALSLSRIHRMRHRESAHG